MNLNDRLTTDMKTAMKAKDKCALNTIRALKAVIKNTAIEHGSIDSPLEHSEIIKIIRKQVKQRIESIEKFNAAGRTDLSSNEQAEIEILEKYLPQPMSTEEITSMVSQTIEETGASSRSDMGKVIKILQNKTNGSVDGKILSQAVMEQLA